MLDGCVDAVTGVQSVSRFRGKHPRAASNKPAVKRFDIVRCSIL